MKRKASSKGLRGGLRIHLGGDTKGETRLRCLQNEPPLHVGKGYKQADKRMLFQIMTPSTGYFPHDKVDIQGSVESGARVILYSPALARVHPSREAGGVATVNQALVADGEGSDLAFCTEGLQLLPDSRLVQRTTLRLEAGSSLYFEDVLYPGRILCGDAFRFHSYHSGLDIFCDGEHVYRERINWEQGNPGLASWQQRMRNSVLISAFICGAQADCPERLKALQEMECVPRGVRWGVTQLNAMLIVVRGFASSSSEVRPFLNQVRHLGAALSLPD